MSANHANPVNMNRLFDPIGASEACRCISEHFHRRIESDSALRQIFPKSMAALSEHFALFLGERLGGPATYTTTRGKHSLICRHAHLSISTDEADRWLAHMFGAMDDAGIVDPSRVALRSYFTETAKTLSDPCIPLYRLPLGELSIRIREEPELLRPSSMGHSLLREAVSRWDAPRVRLLLESGADANTIELLGHGPLYRAVNAEVKDSEAQGCEVVELLIQYGADVNLASGPSKSTPLHMAARRGHVFMARVLLNSGADIEARDSKGETPLRRAVNCAQEPMVNFLVYAGADTASRDKKGQTPTGAARSNCMRKALILAVDQNRLDCLQHE